jgi:hypothetical protein
MKKLILAILIFTITLNINAVNGSLEYNIDQEILNLWGNNYEMGFAQGYLLNERIPVFFSKFFFDIVGLTYLDYEYVHTNYNKYFVVPEKYREEAKGLIDGIIASGEEIFISELDRDLTVKDILMANSVLDLSYVFSNENPLGCSSLSAWGKVTRNDTLINGNIIIGRNFDLLHEIGVAERGLIITFEPDNGKSWVSFGYPMIIAPISGINENMLFGAINVGYHYNTPYTTPHMEPIQFIQREIFENPDFNQDNTVNYKDLYEKVLEVNNAGAWLLHTVTPYVDSSTISAAVLECVNESGDTFRTSKNDTNLYPWYLLALNHEEVNYEPISDPRYNVTLDSLQENPDITFNRMRNIMRALASRGTLQTIFFLPNDSLFAVSFADSSHDASHFDPLWYKWDDLFPNHQTMEELLASREKTLFLPDIQRLAYTEEISIYSITGRKIGMEEIDNISSGYYFVKRQNDERIYKLLIIK